MEEKVALVSAVRDRYGLSVALRAVELPRSTWYYRTRRRVPYEEKYAHLRAPLETIAEEHSGYGYRRATSELREAYGGQTNLKVVQRLHQLWDLPLMRTVSAPKPSAVHQAIEVAGSRANLLARREKTEIGPLAVFYTDFTELRYADGTRKAWLIPILDHTTKYVAGFAVGENANTDLALTAWTHAEGALARFRASLGGVIVHHDRDPVFTSYAWVGRFLSKRVRLSYALGEAKDNPEMESFFGRFKVENRSLISDAGTLAELMAVVQDRMRYYNRARRHSSLGDLPPLTFIDDFYRGR